jgi:GTP cyclohydrolase II
MSQTEKSDTAFLPTKYGNFDIKVYKESNQEHMAIMSKNLQDIDTPIVRIHSECLTGDTFGSLKCDCQEQLHLALKLIAKKGGLIIYHRQEGRNIGLLNKINAYSLQDQGHDTVEANLKLGFKEDERTYDVIKDIFEDLKITDISLVTNNPDKIKIVEGLGVKVVDKIPCLVDANEYNKNYLETKKRKLNHTL